MNQMLLNQENFGKDRTHTSIKKMPDEESVSSVSGDVESAFIEDMISTKTVVSL